MGKDTKSASPLFCERNGKANTFVLFCLFILMMDVELYHEQLGRQKIVFLINITILDKSENINMNINVFLSFLL